MVEAIFTRNGVVIHQMFDSWELAGEFLDKMEEVNSGMPMGIVKVDSFEKDC